LECIVGAASVFPVVRNFGCPGSCFASYATPPSLCPPPLGTRALRPPLPPPALFRIQRTPLQPEARHAWSVTRNSCGYHAGTPIAKDAASAATKALSSSWLRRHVCIYACRCVPIARTRQAPPQKALTPSWLPRPVCAYVFRGTLLSPLRGSPALCVCTYVDVLKDRC